MLRESAKRLWDERENEGDERYMGEACSLPYCEDRPWVKLVVRGEVVRYERIRRDVEEETTRVWRIRPDSILGETYERERSMCFCKHHATTLMDETIPTYDHRGTFTGTEASWEGMGTCTDCGAENTPCVRFLGGEEGEGLACGVCCDETGVA